MGLVLELKKGTWYRDGKYKELPQVQKNINFLSSKRIEVVGNYIEVGRNSDNDIILDSSYISRSHCSIKKGGWFRTKWYIKDFKAKFGTLIYRPSNPEGKQYFDIRDKEIALQKLDTICFGNYEPQTLLVVET